MSCPFYTTKSSGWFGIDYWCTKLDKEIPDDTYRKYCRDYDYRDCPNYKYQESSSGCFITTVLCGILGLSDNHEVLNTLRLFRNNILQKDEKYAEILKIYDAIGPMVASSIMLDDNREQLAIDLYKSSLLPIVEEIKKENYTRAIQHYLYMTLSLVSEYNLRTTYNALREVDFGFVDFDQTKAGHGKARIRIPETNKQ